MDGQTMPVPAVAPHAGVCGNCAWYGGSGAQGFCRRHPPHLMFLPLVGSTIAGAKPSVSWVTNAAYPPVNPQTPACGECEPKATLLN